MHVNIITTSLQSPNLLQLYNTYHSNVKPPIKCMLLPYSVYSFKGINVCGFNSLNKHVPWTLIPMDFNITWMHAAERLLFWFESAKIFLMVIPQKLPSKYTYYINGISLLCVISRTCTEHIINCRLDDIESAMLIPPSSHVLLSHT